MNLPAHALQALAPLHLVQENHKLVARQTRNQVLGAHGASQALCNLNQHPVADAVAKLVVDELEAVQIDEQHGKTAFTGRDRSTCSLCNLYRLADFLAQAQHECFPIGQAGQAVGLQTLLHGLKTSGELADFIRPLDAHWPVQLAVPNAQGSLGQVLEVTRHPAQDAHAKGNGHQRRQRTQNRRADQVFGHAGHEIAARHGHHSNPLQPGVVLDAVKRGMNRLSVWQRETQLLCTGFGVLCGKAGTDFCVDGCDDGAFDVGCADAHLFAIRQFPDIGADRRRNQVSVRLDDERQAVLRNALGAYKVIELVQRYVGGHHAFQLAPASQHPARPGSHQVIGAEVNVDRRPGLPACDGTGLVPSALPWVV